MTIRRLVTAIAFLSIFAMSARISIDPDTWWHLRAGQWIVENGAVPQADPFSYTRFGESWQYPGWLVQAPMFGIFQIFGAGGLNIWTALMVTAAFYFVWKTMSGGPVLRAFVFILAGAAAGVYWAARPYLVSFLLAAVFLWILEDYRSSRKISARKRLWLLPVLMVVWANSHGGFAAGFLLWGVYFAAAFLSLAGAWWKREDLSDSLQYFKPLAFSGLLMAPAVALNPSGPVMLLYPFKTVEIGVLQDYIQEWQSPNFHDISTQPFAWLLLVTLGVVGASRRRLRLEDFLLTAGFAYMGLLAGRNIAFFALVAPMVITRHADPLIAAFSRQWGLPAIALDDKRRSALFLNSLIFVVLILAVAAKLLLVVPDVANEKAYHATLPVEEVAYLKSTSLSGRLFNSYNWGGYLLWELPDVPVFVDGRTDLYSDEIIGQWVQVVQAQDGWQQVLESWDVKYILLEKERPVIDRLPSKGWRLLYQGELGVIYERP